MSKIDQILESLAIHVRMGTFEQLENGKNSFPAEGSSMFILAIVETVKRKFEI